MKKQNRTTWIAVSVTSWHTCNAYSTGAMNWSRSCDENVAGTLSIQTIALRGDSPLAFITWLKQAPVTTSELYHLAVKTNQINASKVITNYSTPSTASLIQKPRALCTPAHLQGSHSLLKTKFEDLSRTFNDQIYDSHSKTNRLCIITSTNCLCIPNNFAKNETNGCPFVREWK